MKCPRCHAENSEGSQFCGKCGESFQTKPTCPQCGHENPDDNDFCNGCGHRLITETPPVTPPSSIPTSFVNDRYTVKKFLGEGGKKKVYLAYDTLLDRDVAFALIKTEKLDDASRMRISREAKAMGKLGDHPNIVTIYDFGQVGEQPYVVLPLMPGGDIEGLIEKAPERRLPIERAIKIIREVCNGLEHAHAKGIIHRDIKPGNVWLSGDGTAKVGDFGLALAVDVSRLTGEGMMVGTYYYMPPEQALGSEITPRADLYSVGAMLYEMVTGRPPFMGDGAVAIIGQHINTPPVSPNWHRPDLPPPLAALIMRLLEKDPRNRLGTAREVLEAIEAVEACKSAELSAEVSSVLAESPLYRRVFVGRETELRQLQSAFDAAASGQGSVMMVVGEPGIGKTALTEQLGTYVSLRNGRVLVGHCYEEGSLSLPYLAFVEVLRSYAQARNVSHLKKELGTGARSVARIVSEVRERLKIKPGPQVNPEEERYQLMQGVTEFLGSAAMSQPLLIVLEDLHSADKGTLEMLEHVGRNLADKRLLIAGTYRDVEVDRTHPLSAALAELRRLPGFGRVLLRGLNVDEVRRLLSSIAGQEVPWSLAEVVHRQTEGNPLFVQEVVRYLVEDGVFTREGGQWRASSDTPVEMRIPDGLRDVIGKRLSRLSESCNQVLSVAAVIGRDFQPEVLLRVAGIADDELVAALEEAMKMAVVEERTGVGARVSYRFAHAFFRQTLYEEIIAPRRIRLHRQVATALEEIYKNRLEEHAAELAEHFSHSSDNADLEKSIIYGEMAAKRATGVYAFGEAARLLEQALKVQEILDPHDKGKQCDLLLELGEARFYDHEFPHVLDTEAPMAFSLAEELGDKERACRACYLAVVTLGSAGGMPAFVRAEAVRWVNAYDRHAPPGTIHRSWADFGIAYTKGAAGDMAGAVPILRDSALLARKLGDENAFVAAGAGYLFYCPPVSEWVEEGRQIAESVKEMWDRVAPEEAAWARLYVGGFLLSTGQRQEAEEIHRELVESSRFLRLPRLRYHAPTVRACYQIMDGQLEEAAHSRDEALRLGVELGAPLMAGICAGWSRFRLTGYLGRHTEELGSRDQLPQGTGLPVVPPALEAHGLACTGETEEARSILDEIVDQYAADAKRGESFFPRLILALEAAVLARHPRAAELLLSMVGDTPYRTTGLHNLTCVARHLGGAAALLGRHEEARNHYGEAIKVCTDMRLRPELALTRLQLAELILEHYPDEKNEAVEHLAFCIPEFRDMKMKPWLERALKHKEILKA